MTDATKLTERRNVAIARARALAQELLDLAEGLGNVPNDGDDLLVSQLEATVEVWDTFLHVSETAADRALVLCKKLDILKRTRQTEIPKEYIAVKDDLWGMVLARWEVGKWREPGKPGAPSEKIPWSKDVHCILVRCELTDATSADNMRKTLRRRIDRGKVDG